MEKELALKMQKIERENRILRQILLDNLSTTEMCSICRNKGKNCPECKCTKADECLESMVALYGTGPV